MKTVIGNSKKSDASAAVNEAASNIQNPNLLVYITPYETLTEIAKLINDKFPGVPSIGTSGISYFETEASDKELVIMAFGSDCEAQVGALRYLSSAPLYDIGGLKKAISKVSPGNEDTVCLEFCTNDEERLVSSMNAALEERKVPLVGGTVYGVPEGKKSMVCVNGELFTDACCYAVVKNKSGKIHTYSENIYYADPGAKKHIATRVNLAKKELLTLDNRPAVDVYSEDTGLDKSKVAANALEAPLGRVVGDEVFICSMYATGSNGSLINYKRVNENDTISVLKLGDYESINNDTRNKIKAENSKISFVFSVNCIYRHLLFSQKGHLSQFLGDMGSLGAHVGVVGGGEQYKRQHVNQTMICAVFD